MEGKHGKSGFRTGRTHRSRFAQTRGNRSEGLLTHSSVINSSCKGNQNEGEVVAYSLGKQNRWLLPEAIKTSSVGFEEEVVLIERYTNAGNKTGGRSDCVSVFNSKNGSTRKPRRKFAQAKDLLGDSEEMKTQYEVTYPLPSGSWTKSTKRPAGRLGKRKKNCSTSWMLDEDDDDDDFSEIEYSDGDTEEDFSEQLERSSRLDLDILINLSAQTAPEVHAGGIGTSQSMKYTQHEQSTLALGGTCYVESDEEMQETHLQFLAQIKVGCSLLDARDQIRNNQLSTKPEVQKHGCRRARNLRNKSANGSVSLENNYFDPVEPVHPDGHEGVVVTLRRQEIMPATLTQQWCQMYKEGASYPRAFVLNVTPLMSLSNSKEVFIVFRVFEDHEKYNASQTKALVTMVVCNDDNNNEKTLADFISRIEAKSADQEIWSLEDIANEAICFHSELMKNNGKVDCKEPRKPRMSLDVFTNLFGWKSKTYSSQTAKQQVKQCLTEVTAVTTRSATVASGNNQRTLECEICFKDMQDEDSSDVTNSFSLLTACGHKFCNDCWKAHLKTQIEHGHTYLRCPGHECNTAVDDVTLMSLVPSLYGRHLTKRLDTCLEMDPEWKWCPADQCKLVVKATTPQQRSVVCNAEQNSIVQPVPVACVCGTMWCFRCQEDAHWPAACDEARVFRQKNEGYAKMVKNSTKTSLITSVEVKHCPSCNYPVEKGLGCNHTVCVLCNKQFCWACLQDWCNHVKCKLVISLRKVQLPTMFVHAVSYEHIAVTSRVARTSSLICKIHRRLDKIEEALNIYAKCFPLKPELKTASHTEQRLKLLYENKATHFLKEVFNFKFQAHLVLEGVAIRLSFSNDTAYSKRLAMEFSRLLFIVERMDEILKDLNHCLAKKESLFKLERFVKFGKKCILFIGRNTNEPLMTTAVTNE